MEKSLILLVLSTCCWYLADGHVALTFPPARQYDLDFLDNSRTPGPCGMPKGEHLNLINFELYISEKKGDGITLNEMEFIIWK